MTIPLEATVPLWAVLLAVFAVEACVLIWAVVGLVRQRRQARKDAEWIHRRLL